MFFSQNPPSPHRHHHHLPAPNNTTAIIISSHFCSLLFLFEKKGEKIGRNTTTHIPFNNFLLCKKGFLRHTLIFTSFLLQDCNTLLHCFVSLGIRLSIFIKLHDETWGWIFSDMLSTVPYLLSLLHEIAQEVPKSYF